MACDTIQNLKRGMYLIRSVKTRGKASTVIRVNFIPNQWHVKPLVSAIKFRPIEAIPGSDYTVWHSKETYIWYQ